MRISAAAELPEEIQIALQRRPSLSSNPLVPLRDMAISFFLSNHVIEPSTFSSGHLDCSIRLLKLKENESPMSPLTPAVRAVGMASYSNIVGSPDLLHAATMDYMSALRLTNMSLSNPDEATKDSVLLSVILLGIHENITFTGNKNLVHWNNHVKGSLQLKYLCGKKQFDTKDGLQLWHMVSAMIVSSCIQRECLVPQPLRKLCRYISGSIDTQSFHWLLVEHMIRFVNFSADVDERKISGLTLIDAGISIDEQLATHFSRPNLPDHMAFYNVNASDAHPDLVYGGVYSVYRDWNFVSMWNHMRIARLYLQRMIQRE